MQSRATPSAPNLFRAVAECTQPYGPPPSVAAVRSLQAYLTDGSCVDSVYQAILARACAEPQSEAVIAKCIGLIRQYVSRYPPSAAVLAAIASACQRLAGSLPPDSGLQKSLLYLESSVSRTADRAQANKRLAKVSARSAGSNASSKSAWPQGAAANGDLAASSSSSRAAVAAAAAGGSVHSSASEDVLAGLPGKGMPSLWGSAEQQQQQHQQQQRQQQQQLPQQPPVGQGWAPALQEQQHDLVRAVPAQPVLPDWTFQPSALQELWSAGPDGLEDDADLDWSVLSPQLSSSLVPLVDGLPGMEVLNLMSCQHVVDGITGADVAIQLRQMQEITEVRRLQFGVSPELLQQAMQQSLANRGRRLFQPLPYTQQEQADVLASDVAAVVEVLCGKPSPAAPSAITGAVGLDDPDTYWQQPHIGAAGTVQQPLLLLYQQTSSLGGPQQQQQQRHTESIGQISSCILMKMIVDLWLSVGGAAAFPLVLRMLQQSLYQLQPQYRARTFDIIYNLALHGSMLMPSVSSPPPSPQVHASRQRGMAALDSALAARQQQQQQQSSADWQLQGVPEFGPRDMQASPGSTYSQDDANGGGMPSLPQSPSSFPPAQNNQQQQQQTPGSPLSPGMSGPSPQPSPRARSRLSRSELTWMAVPDKATQRQQQQQQPGLGPSSSSSSFQASTPAGDAAATAAGGGGAVGVGAAGYARGPASMAAVQEGTTSSKAGDGSIHAGVPVEVAWEAWLHQLLFELLLMLSMMDEPCEAVWQSALGCLLQLTTHAGHWVAASLSQLPPAAAAALLDACVEFHWSEELHARLVQMAVNLLYLSEHAATGQSQGSVAAAGRCLSPLQQELLLLQQQRAGQQQPQQHSQQQQHRPWRWRQQSPVSPKPADDTALASPEDVAVTLDTSVGGRDRQHQADAKGANQTAAAAAVSPSSEQVSEGRTASAPPHSSTGSQLGDLDLPWQLHAGPVDEQQLAAFGGPAKLLQHFCHAGSVEAQRTLLVPLLQVLMPHDAPDTAQLAVLQALCARPSCLAALQAAVSAGLPGWSTYVVAAVQQHLGPEGLDVPLLSYLLLQLEELSVQRVSVELLELAVRPQAESNSSSSRSNPRSQPQQDGQQPQPPQQQHQQQEHEEDEEDEAMLLQFPPEVEVAMQVTLQQLRGQPPSQPQMRPGPSGTDVITYQVAPEVQGSWKSLRALCWCDDGLARLACKHWLQQLLAVTLQQSLKGAILLPLPGVRQCMSAPTDSATAGSVAGVAAACEAWSEVLQQLAAHCPGGTQLLVDALQLHMASCKLHMDDASLQQQQQQRQRAAVARECVQAWAFVCQWVMQARVSHSQAALTRLAAMAQSMSCVFDVSDWPAGADEGGNAAAAALAAARQHLQSRRTPPPPAAAAAADEPAAADAARATTTTAPPPSSSATAATAVDASSESLGFTTALDSSRDFEGGLKGVPPPELSSEPSALARLWPGGATTPGGGGAAAAGQDAGGWCESGSSPEQATGAAAAAAAAATAARAAAEGVCWPQAFLLGCALLIQQLAQVLSGTSLALLLVRLLQCRPPSRAADRGFHGRPCTSSSSSSGTAGVQGLAAAPCPVLYPWSDGRQDLQLSLVLMLISSCSGDAESFAELGLEAVTQQVLSGCTDPRVCLLASQVMLEHLMQHQQERYWAALRQLVTAAQHANDERLLGNPFLQLVALLSEQQPQPQSSARPAGTPAAADQRSTPQQR